MNTFDLVVIGAGPAGGHCARLLAKIGHKVLLVERYKDFNRNSFSSAGTPLATLKQFNLPNEVVGSFWNRLVIVTSNKQGVWESDANQGCVLDFTKLREFLANEVKANGGEVWMGSRYVDHCEQSNGILVTIKNNLTNESIKVVSRVLVDATGANRAITCRKGKPRSKLTTGTGVEYLVRVNDEAYDRNAKALTFLLGHKWMPKGYSWIFPMGKNHLKIGAGIWNEEHKLVKEVKPLKYYIELLLKEYVKPDDYEILDIHGETLRYSRGLQDTYTQGKAIAIGDTVSTVNLLGGEGIRQAMSSSQIATKYIDQFLKGDRLDFNGYREEMHSIFLTKWKMSESLSSRVYIEGADTLVDKVVSYLKPMKLEDIVRVLFYYEFDKVSKGLGNYIWRKLTSKLRSLVSLISNLFKI
ncbi:MAG: dehydrogenase [Oscillatoriales cyanobacterium CG2_30_44_21]|nr:MAG: dehydrogenase [Oscillatoriales cyanobacterium CG2_30_44_21]